MNRQRRKQPGMKRFVGAFRLVLAVLREIFDESAYSRFLHRTHMKSSAQAYSAFWREREAAQQRRPKCC